MRLREIRKARGLTQRELSERTGIHQANISAMECGRRATGRRGISAETLRRLAQGLEVSMDELMTVP